MRCLTLCSQPCSRYRTSMLFASTRSVGLSILTSQQRPSVFPIATAKIFSTRANLKTDQLQALHSQTDILFNNKWLALHHTHTHTRLTTLCPSLPGWADTRKVKPVWTLLEQETVSGTGISWAICKSAPHSRQITMPAPHYWSFLRAGCPSCRPTNSVKALKAQALKALHQCCAYYF